MKKTIIIASLAISNLFFSPKEGFSMPKDDVAFENCTLVVGNTRGEGSIDKVIEPFVFPEGITDFTHRTSFPDSKVISIDMGPCRIKKLNKLHIQGDFLSQPLNEFSYKRIFFEWMPSCTSNMQPLLQPSVSKAFNLLPSGGELIIDHMPYRIALEPDVSEALKQLREFGYIIPTDAIKRIPKNTEERYPGIFSEILQSIDVFTFHRSQRERLDIYNILAGKKRVLLDHKSFFSPNIIDHQTNMEAVFYTITKMSETFGKSELEMYEDLIGDMQTNVDGATYLIFEWIYYMFSRQDLIKNGLESIGFIVPENFIQHHDTNPYNGRKNAWLIKAYKP
ncbi:MAG: hypothetical protein C0432_03020 [Candidatus Puniceispirillum sp.]|nr:hypothetical protein [Candidatus Pelagibacter sp.]MBA4283247.1 hypothetical protein [Candidatus Puniceispirillum sp.]